MEQNVLEIMFPSSCFLWDETNSCQCINDEVSMQYISKILHYGMCNASFPFKWDTLIENGFSCRRRVSIHRSLNVMYKEHEEMIRYCKKAFGPAMDSGALTQKPFKINNCGIFVSKDGRFRLRRRSHAWSRLHFLAIWSRSRNWSQVLSHDLWFQFRFKQKVESFQNRFWFRNRNHASLLTIIIYKRLDWRWNGTLACRLKVPCTDSMIYTLRNFKWTNRSRAFWVRK